MATWKCLFEWRRGNVCLNGDMGQRAQGLIQPGIGALGAPELNGAETAQIKKTLKGVRANTEMDRVV